MMRHLFIPAFFFSLLACNSVQNKLENLNKKLDADEKEFMLNLAEDTNVVFAYEFDSVYQSKNIDVKQLARIKKIINKYSIEELHIYKRRVNTDPKYFQLNENEYRTLILSKENAKKIQKEEQCIQLIRLDSNAYIGVYPESI